MIKNKNTYQSPVMKLQTHTIKNKANKTYESSPYLFATKFHFFLLLLNKVHLWLEIGNLYLQNSMF